MGLVARTDRPAIIGHGQVPCTGIEITRDDRVPGLPIRGDHEPARPPSAGRMASTGEPGH
jgi:hypothetical protein